VAASDMHSHDALLVPRCGHFHWLTSLCAGLCVTQVTAPPVTPISEVELNTTFLQRRMEQCNTRFTRAAARELARSLAASSSDGLAKAVHALESLFVQSRFRNAGVECEWEPDKERDSCGQCHKPFTLFRRRHHCRSCGLLICSACETSQALPGYPCTDPQVRALVARPCCCFCFCLFHVLPTAPCIDDPLVLCACPCVYVCTWGWSRSVRVPGVC